jgi:hypothetical protein
MNGECDRPLLVDAGRGLLDADGMCHADSPVALAEYPGIGPRSGNSILRGGPGTGGRMGATLGRSEFGTFRARRLPRISGI